MKITATGRQPNYNRKYYVLSEYKTIDKINDKFYFSKGCESLTIIESPACNFE